MGIMLFPPPHAATARAAAPPRTDLLVTTSLTPAPALEERARMFAAELSVPFVPRRDEGLPRLFAAHPDASRALLVQTHRLLLAARDGKAELFYHPNMAFLRLGNLLRGGRDLLIEAGRIGSGDLVLDATLGYASEAILCAHVAGETGTVHGVEAVPELGVVVREGLQTVTTDHQALNAAMRRVRVVHLGHHLDFLRSCPAGSYDVICFDPFFPVVLPDSETFAPLRAFGDHGALLPEAVAEARRVARRRVVVKAVRWDAAALEALGVRERYDSKSGKVAYGVLPGSG
jgi:hypothetical protein